MSWWDKSRIRRLKATMGKGGMCKARTLTLEIPAEREEFWCNSVQRFSSRKTDVVNGTGAGALLARLEK